MHAEIISTGTELLLGNTINTDSALVARELSALGIDLLFSCVVGDNQGRLLSVLTEALNRSDLVITTGGLGPTDDDLTKETVAKAAGVDLVSHPDSLKRLEAFFDGRPLAENQRKQAMLPEGCTVFPNEIGTAPGCALTTPGGQMIIMLPGPPSELTHMLHASVVPYLKKQSDAVIFSRMIRTFGIGEGRAAHILGELADSRNPTVATYAEENETFFRVTARATNKAKAAALCDPVMDEIQRRFGELIYGIDVKNLESVVVSELTAQKLSLAVAESCTGGLLAKRITSVPGASVVFKMGVVAYANETKARLLGVPEELLQQYGAVSKPVARSMAEGVRRLSGEPLGIGITGVAGPGGGSPEKPVGLIHIALTDGQKTWIRTMSPAASDRQPGRGWLRRHASSHALDLVRRYLFHLSMQDTEAVPVVLD